MKLLFPLWIGGMCRELGCVVAETGHRTMEIDVYVCNSALLALRAGNDDDDDDGDDI